MPEQDSSRSPHQERLNRIVADYLDAVESGRAPDRDEVSAQDPELAREREAFFADHDRMNALARPIALAGATVTMQGWRPTKGGMDHERDHEIGDCTFLARSSGVLSVRFLGFL